MDASGPDSAAGVDGAIPDAGWPDASAGVDGAIGVDGTAADALQQDSGGEDAGVDPLVPTWIPIPGGTFEMGCSPSDDQCDADELPRHTVTISAFEMTETEVTQEQYEAAVFHNPSLQADCPTCPVEQVRWWQARSFCAIIGGRLPTEAEWEYAARAGTTTRFYCGDEYHCLYEIAQFWDTIVPLNVQPVGLKLANDFGLFDMLGNVWEWTADGYMENYYESSPEHDPTGPRTNEDSDRVLRGGGYINAGNDMRASNRVGQSPEEISPYLGVRCAR